MGEDAGFGLRAADVLGPSIAHSTFNKTAMRSNKIDP